MCSPACLSPAVASVCHSSAFIILSLARARSISAMVLSVTERIWLIEHVFRAQGKFTEQVKEDFATQFPDTEVPHRNAVNRLVTKFRDTGTVADAPRSGRPTILTEDKVEEVADVMANNPRTSVRRCQQAVDLSYGSVRTALKVNLSMKAYKISCVHKLHDDDTDKRLAYCRWFDNFIQTQGEGILDDTFYSDEAWFHLSGYVNSQNSRYWASENPHQYHETPLHSQKIGVWCAMSRRRIIGPLFFTETINSERYLDLIIDPFLAQLNRQEKQAGFFQQDGATAHTSRLSINRLREVFGERLISRNIWPPRSPDLTPPDFFFGVL